ncbi:MAG: hypothetical protein QOF52_2911 [Propionibacteriaceae bacterium]|nr:hypothetical protein [Propionibacteriaceae bacterium]
MRPPTTAAKVLGFTAFLATIPGLILATALNASAAPGATLRPVPVPDAIKAAGFDRAGSLAPALRNLSGTVTVSVAMSKSPVAASVPEGALSTRSLPSRANQRGRTADVVSQQDHVISQARKLGAKPLGRATLAANVVAMTIPAKNLAKLAKLSGVVSVKPVGRYKMLADPGGSGSLAQAADYVEATQVRDAGHDGTGVKVAVLDSGVDYTHAYLGGPGTRAAYVACYAGASGKAYDVAPVGPCADLFGPSAPKVKGGFDFVGETWPTTAPVPDPNPIDRGGHGTHVSDIVGGRSADGSHKGIAPGVDLYALKVCSAVTNTCDGPAILQAIDWALDPNNDGDISDAVDIVNLSLGQDYGQEQDDSTLALDNLVRAGVVAVAAAGNAADRPFILSSPSAAPRAISVAQTALPDDKLYSIRVDSPTISGLPGNTIRNARLQPWSPAPSTTIAAPLAQPGANHEGCTAATFAGFPTGAVALIKRGTCNVSLKAQNAQAAGASAVIIWNNLPGDPPVFSFGGGVPVTVPTLSISMDHGTRLSDAVTAGPVRVTIDPAATTSLANTTVGTSSRGPTVSGVRAKPDIGAPGAWLSAEVGTGDGQTSFSGTSGATPVIAGAAALLLDRFPGATPAVVKSRLLNGASTQNRTPAPDGSFYPTPVTRVGAGEVRVAPAVNATGVLRSRKAGAGNIGVGLRHVTKPTTYTVWMRLTNTGTQRKTYLISPDFRDSADAASTAVRVSAPDAVRVPANGKTDFKIKVRIDPKKLDAWPFTHAAGYTGDGSELNGPEFDGYLKAIAADETLHLGWTVLPHRSAKVSAKKKPSADGQPRVELTNTSAALDGGVNVFGLTGTSPRMPKPGPGQPGSSGSNVAVIDLAAVGVRDDVSEGIIQFGVAGHRRQTIPLYPAGYQVDVDTNRDGTPDYAVLQMEAGGPGMSGQSLVYVVNVATKQATPYFFTNADFDVSTQVLAAPLSALGLTRGSTFDFRVLAFDNYFTGLVSDAILGQTWTVGAEKFSLAGSADSLVVPSGRTVQVGVSERRQPVASSQTGLLLLFDDAAKRDAQAVQLAAGEVTP